MVVELDGGGHYNPEAAEKDRIREKQLEMEGLKILRFCNLDIDKNFYGVISVIDKEVKERINFKAEASILGHSPSQLR